MILSVFFVAAILLLSTTVVLACSPIEATPEPLRYGPKCAFSRVFAIGGRMSGEAVQELAPGTYSQVVTFEDETLVVTDCARAEYVQVSNFGNIIDWIELFRGGSCPPNLTLDYVLPPEGKLKLDGDTTLADVRETARSEGYLLQAMDQWEIDRFDPFCSCGLYYPDSAGAEKSRGLQMSVRN